MSDARSLLRAHRAQNRISHPYAAYTDAGKLLCKLCHEPVKAEGLWDTHLRSQSHRQRVALLQGRPTVDSNNDSGPSKHKRKHSDVDRDEDMPSADDEDAAAEEALPKKRSRNRLISSTASSSVTAPLDRSDTATPPALTRKSSHGTPIQGVEIQIPSRPATPGSSSTSTPHHHASLGRSQLGAANSGDAMSISTPTPTSTPSVGGTTMSTERLAVHTAPLAPSAASAVIAGSVDEAEWAAFEAEVAAADASAPAPASTNVFAAEAVISAPAMTAGQVTVKLQEEENERRKQLLEAQIADEREDATRALEEEFDEMAELEVRVRKLKERREQLRKAAMSYKVGAASGKENAQVAGSVAPNEDDDDDDEDDGWDDGFRFRA